MSTDNQDNNITDEGSKGNEGNDNKTFTQAEVDAIINGRFGRMMEKYKDYDELKAKADKYDKVQEASKTELQKAQEKANSLQAELDKLNAAAQARALREEVSKETGVPAELLTGSTKEECTAQAEAIKNYAGGSKLFPPAKDKGEQNHTGGNTPRDKFADWFNDFNS